MENKLRSMKEAIKKWVKDGDTIVLGAQLETAIPFSAGHEIIRQGKKDLTLIAGVSDILFDQMIGAGGVKKIIAAWVGNVIRGSAYNFRRAVEEKIPKALEIEDHTNFTIALALKAGAMGIPFLPTKTLLGTDLFKTNPKFKKMKCPFSGKRLALIPALNPDLAILHLQRADRKGNAQAWGNTGLAKEAALASKKVIVVVEEAVSEELIRRDPNRTIIPGFLVNAVVEDKGGAHPSPLPGYYNRDHKYFMDYHGETKTRKGFLSWLDKWVYQVKDRQEYLKLLGKKRFNQLKIKKSRPSLPIEYGF